MHFGEIFFFILQLPIYPTWFFYIFLEKITGLALVSDDSLTWHFGTQCDIYACIGFYSFTDFLSFIIHFFNSFSGALWGIMGPGKMEYIPIVILFLCGMFIISTQFDTHIQYKISLQNQKNHKKSFEKFFSYIYGAWRIFLPDFFIIGAILAKACNIKLSEEKIYQLNVRIQGIRLALFAFFFLVSWSDLWEFGVYVSDIFKSVL